MQLQCSYANYLLKKYEITPITIHKRVIIYQPFYSKRKFPELNQFFGLVDQYLLSTRAPLVCEVSYGPLRNLKPILIFYAHTPAEVIHLVTLCCYHTYYTNSTTTFITYSNHPNPQTGVITLLNSFSHFLPDYSHKR